MNAGLILFAGILVLTGKWTKGEPVSVPTVVGLFSVALFVGAIETFSREIARGFAVLFLVSVFYSYGPDLMKAMNLATVRKGVRRVERDRT